MEYPAFNARTSFAHSTPFKTGTKILGLSAFYSLFDQHLPNTLFLRDLFNVPVLCDQRKAFTMDAGAEKQQQSVRAEEYRPQELIHLCSDNPIAITSQTYDLYIKTAHSICHEVVHATSLAYNTKRLETVEQGTARVNAELQMPSSRASEPGSIPQEGVGPSPSN